MGRGGGQKYENAGWAIKSLDTSEYCNNLGDSGSIGGWSGDGTKFDLYDLVEAPAAEVDLYGKLRGYWTKVSVDTETVYSATEGLFEYAWDNNPGTIWHSNWQGASDKLTGENTFSGVIDFGQVYVINQFSFTPRVGNASGQITQASLYVKAAEDAEWTLVAEHAAFAANGDKKDIDFSAQEVRYVKFVAEQSNDGWVAVSEFDVAYVAPAHEHSYTGEVTTAATCTTAGVMTCTCECGDSYTEEIPAQGHSHEADVTAPTCTEGGYTTYTCACGDSYIADETEALGHEYMDGTCTRCGAVDDDFYGENEIITRGKLAYLLWDTFGRPEPEMSENPFTDISEDDKYYRAVLWAAENGIIYGPTVTTIAHTEPCTRAEVTAILWRAVGSPEPYGESPYSDVEPGSYYYKAVCWAAEQGLQISYVCANQFRPLELCTFGQLSSEERIHFWKYQDNGDGTHAFACDVCAEKQGEDEPHSYVDGSCTVCGGADPDYEVVIASGWSGYTTWKLTEDGVLTVSPSGQTFEGKVNMRSYWKENGELSLPWGEHAALITKVVIEEGVHTVGQMAFYGLPNLQEVQLPESIVEIRGYAFKNCSALTAVNLEVVEFVREGAFYGCSELDGVTFAEGVVIEDWAFAKTPVQLP